LEQRRTQRYKLQLPLHILQLGGQRSVAPRNAGHQLRRRLLHVPSAVEVGGKIEYLITLSGSNPPVRIRCLGKVLRSHKPAADNGLFEIAVTMERYHSCGRKNWKPWPSRPELRPAGHQKTYGPWRFALTMLLTLAAGLPLPGAGKIFPYPYVQQDLPNGLRLITIPTDYPNIVSLYIVSELPRAMKWNRARGGFAHLFEHLMFRGTRSFRPSGMTPY